ncbi:3064_t:CDS:2 [Paraglomus occultum]|uniref:3064_t:CDS:1 n=1 Tax=Paraglomus occultum TaxID=144539 RepID=A0A9N8WLH4_9GLOM|nr:3064_t:CDS:2 [Paraglomus occultum]
MTEASGKNLAQRLGHSKLNPPEQIKKPGFCRMEDVENAHSNDENSHPTTVCDSGYPTAVCDSGYSTAVWDGSYSTTVCDSVYQHKNHRKQGHWTKEEDDILLEIVEIFGPGNWEKKSIYHPTRNGKQMRERWISHLNGVNKGPFSDKEIDLVYRLHVVEGKGWAEIARALGNNRTANSCKNVYYNVAVKKFNRPKMKGNNNPSPTSGLTAMSKYIPKEKCARKKPPMVPKDLCKLEAVVVDDVCAYNSATVSDKLEKYQKLKIGHWTPEEDKILLEIVKTYGPHNWYKISIYHPTRTSKQMRERWLSHLRGVNKTQFADKEVAAVYDMHDIEKKGWADIAKLVTAVYYTHDIEKKEQVDIAKLLGINRTPNSCKNSYHNMRHKKLYSCPKAANEYKAFQHSRQTVHQPRKNGN